MLRFRTLQLAAALVATVVLMRWYDRLLAQPRLNFALVAAVEQNDLATTKRLIRAGAEVNAKCLTAGRFGFYPQATVLMLAARLGHDATVLQLLDAGATLEGRDEEGRTALIHAAVGGQSHTVDLLLRAR